MKMMTPPSWFRCQGCTTQQARPLLLRRWQKVGTTGRTARGNGWRVGESHHRARISDYDVELIRCLHEEGMSCAEIARKFECARTTVSSIVNYRHRVESPAGSNLVFE